jgi:hypothetical protein
MAFLTLFTGFALAAGFPAIVALAKSDVDAPPSGLTSSTAHVRDILAAHDAATGASLLATKKTVVEHWTFVDSGLAGTETLERSGSNYHSRITSGPFVDEYGQSEAGRWHFDANGFPSPTTEDDERSFYAVRVLEDAEDPKNDVSLLGITTGSDPAYVLRVKQPNDKHPEFVFYDKTSAQIVRVETPIGSRRIVETYGDFRTTDGITQAWHIHDTDGRPELDDDWTMTSVAYGDPLASSVFQVPANRPTISAVSAPTPIPARTIVWGYVIRVNVNGRGMDFLLDSASPRSIIDRDVAQEMNLPTFGQTTHLADGTPVSYRTLLADADVAGIHFHNFVMTSESFAFEPDYSTKVVGILGYDFFAANVLHFDTANGKLEALPASAFATANPVDGGFDLPFRLDDGMPLVAFGIGDTVSQNAVLSTIMPFTVIFGGFVDAHPGDLQDAPGQHHATVVPFDDGEQYGTKVSFWTSMVPHLRFGVFDYQKPGVETTNYPFTIGDQQVDAMVGSDYLRFYDLYFAYPYGRLIAKPNALFYKFFHKG